ncbi:putative MFS family arabinose efflux permease [Paraburkholderia sp. Clong3]
MLLVVAFPLLLRTFWRHEQCTARDGWPLVDPEALRLPAVRLGLGAALFFYSIAVMFLLLAIYLQDALAEDPFTAGMRFAPFGIGFFLGPLCAPRATRIAGAWAVVLALVLEVVALLATAAQVRTALPTSTDALVPLLFLIGFGQGLAMPMLLRGILAEVPAHFSGLMSGTINSTFQISAALGVAVIGSVYYAWLGARSEPAAIGFAFAVALVCVAFCLSMSVLLIALMIRTPKRAA